MDDRNSLLSFVLARYYFDGFLIGNVSELCESYKVKMCDFQVVESIELSCGLWAFYLRILRLFQLSLFRYFLCLENFV